jgi:hypothetical protein|tara:strand:+ start:2636 stop:2791 length:156 start_codon:yes stop_codon:yes gene_type:complete
MDIKYKELDNKQGKHFINILVSTEDKIILDVTSEKEYFNLEEFIKLLNDKV